MAMRRVQLAAFSKSFLKVVHPVPHSSAVVGASHFSWKRQSPSGCQAPRCNSCLLHTSTVVGAGHSKWANIKHVKAAQDKAKAAVGQDLSKRIQHCLIQNPETDPKLNTGLAALIKSARANNIPNDLIEKTVDRVVKLRDPNSITTFDGRGPGNTGIVIECFSLKPHHTKGLLQGIVKKYGFNLHNSGADLFDHKGVIEVDVPEEELTTAQSDPDNFNLDKYVDMAIEAGAEDVTLETESETPYLQFLCSPHDVFKVQKVLEDSGLTVNSGERTYIPNLMVPVSQEFLTALGKMTDKLETFPDVIKYYFNIEPEESSS
ncbi:probable transcriptional regulatory protein Dgeo_2194 [Aplysia californica]|uniref:Probable transcriptional regulatory protein Dgeo_2194 n=1 Tax=Aplysia californica TaxID=6500 RepID=A0ABM1AFQ5_APLCA|nr:probable transcriptional regulatory protein Dgeo_2194 [Aplysia californica]XP_012946759.1 probable transcriptional regulatory protein Dgeo_2194 [Aplysia californica]